MFSILIIRSVSFFNRVQSSLLDVCQFVMLDFWDDDEVQFCFLLVYCSSDCCCMSCHAGKINVFCIHRWRCGVSVQFWSQIRRASTVYARLFCHLKARNTREIFPKKIKLKVKIYWNGSFNSKWLPKGVLRTAVKFWNKLGRSRSDDTRHTRGGGECHQMSHGGEDYPKYHVTFLS